MPKVPKLEDGKLNVGVPDLDQITSDISGKSLLTSPRVTRLTATTIAMAELDLNILFKFVKSYDDNRETQNSFLVNCDNAFELASDVQKPILFKFILSQFSGKAEESRQGLQENVTQYALRMETYLSQLLTEISLSTSKLKELPARTAAMEDLVLHHFLMGLLKTVFNPVFLI
ncbi:hypothetical protein KGM_211273 [Danaus plexippus plexippus]|uniref:Uncharacterized protein n=1 Tax=Danaus plexippus plexippus TaxID=278856 RepID=A0A212EUJ5_DANPL|nr:hypothetical protein KGM_211273 [Danaus plexippus plexippus]